MKCRSIRQRDCNGDVKHLRDTLDYADERFQSDREIVLLIQFADEELQKDRLAVGSTPKKLGDVWCEVRLIICCSCMHMIHSAQNKLCIISIDE